jgi:(p)ppGpp synthase/HD superfamily hydrolase
MMRQNLQHTRRMERLLCDINSAELNTDQNKINWCIEQHRNTNHYYDEYLPYEFHLRMVTQVAYDFLHLPENRWSDLILACWGHDLIEDTRISYNDCVKVLGEYVADIIYAITNEKGKTRAERANDDYYSLIRETPGATFVKLCDRIANVQYSKLTKSVMFNMYIKENTGFINKLNPDNRFQPMVDYLNKLFN